MTRGRRRHRAPPSAPSGARSSPSASAIACVRSSRRSRRSAAQVPPMPTVAPTAAAPTAVRSISPPAPRSAQGRSLAGVDRGAGAARARGARPPAPRRWRCSASASCPPSALMTVTPVRASLSGYVDLARAQPFDGGWLRRVLACGAGVVSVKSPSALTNCPETGGPGWTIPGTSAESAIRAKRVRTTTLRPCALGEEPP